MNKITLLVSIVLSLQAIAFSPTPSPSEPATFAEQLEHELEFSDLLESNNLSLSDDPNLRINLDHYLGYNPIGWVIGISYRALGQKIRTVTFNVSQNSSKKEFRMECSSILNNKTMIVKIYDCDFKNSNSPEKRATHMAALKLKFVTENPSLVKVNPNLYILGEAGAGLIWNLHQTKNLEEYSTTLIEFTVE